MIAKIRRGSWFKGLYDYLMSEAKGLAEDDVEVRNLVAVETAAAEMRVAASRSSRVEKPVYHLIVGWHEDERPTRQAMFEVCHDLVGRLGLADHQALFRRHREPKAGAVPGDGRHYEMHLLINRVGPSGRVAKMSNDFALAERAIAEIAEERSMRVVPGRFNGRGGFVQGSNEKARSSSAAAGLLSVAMEIRSRSDVMTDLAAARARGWPALIETFGRHGIKLHESNRTVRQGQSAGLVMTLMSDPARSEKISALDTPDLKWGRPSLERQLGPFPVGTAAAAGAFVARETSSVLRIPQLDSHRSRSDFQAAREIALSERHRIGERHGDAKRRLAEDQIQRRAELIGSARRRRHLVVGYFGRNSRIGAAMNLIADRRSADHIAKVMDEHRQERRVAEARYRDALARVPVPTWADWRRSGADKGRSIPPGPPVEIDRSDGCDPSSAHPNPRSPDLAAASLTMAFDEHVRRRERLDLNRQRKTALKRGELDARVAAIADELCVAVAAEIIRRLRARNGVRIVALVIAALATGSSIAPVVLAAAAVALRRRGDLQIRREALRADMDASRAARTGWHVGDVAAEERVHYVALVRSDLFDAGGTDAGSVLAAIGAKKAASFIAWWAYATPRQRATVEAWGQPRLPRKHAPPTRSRLREHGVER